MIFIYDDGIHNNGALMTAVQNAYINADVRYCTASMIIDDCLDNATLLIMPGGADLYFCEKLNGVSNQKIKKFVSNGGSYLGICAGAYYACASLDWNNGEIDGTRELALYDGTATGPVFEWVEKPDSIYDGSWIKAVKIKTSTGKEFLTNYNGGPLFSEPTTESVEVIARYSELPDTPPAIIKGRHGKGHYILSSSHIEIFGDTIINQIYEHQNTSFQYEIDVAKNLINSFEHQKVFFNKLLQDVS
jgi:glutamine amidotransferase-like uncharacterized protein